VVKFETPTSRILPAGPQVVERPGQFRGVGQHVGAMDLVQVDHVGAQAAQRRIAGRG